MVVHKRKKLIRQRGSKTHGWGAMKKHRGAGNRGGRGMAGSGKRADQMKTWIIKKYGLDNYFGKHGFNIPQKIKQIDNTINIKDLPNKDEINLTEMGYTKLLSKGNINKKIKVIVKSCSKNAKEKIEKAGGQVIIQ
jgi:large subunit ribosomal protein L15